MQLTLVSSCTHHFLEKGYEEWLLLTDTDEFLSYNYILPGENISHFDKDSIFQGRRAPSVQKRATDRVKASLTFSEQGRGSPNNTILSFIETQRSKHEVYFPSQSGCTRIAQKRAVLQVEVMQRTLIKTIISQKGISITLKS
jgi:hypothetical protein